MISELCGRELTLALPIGCEYGVVLDSALVVQGRSDQPRIFECDGGSKVRVTPYCAVVLKKTDIKNTNIYI